MSLFIVDVEAEGPCPTLGKMTEFGAVLFDAPPFRTRWHCDHPPNAKDMLDFDSWLALQGPRSIFVSDNPAYDWMWMCDAFWKRLNRNPFGHSARRIGDIYAGFKKDLSKSSEWKKLRKTKHDHNPVNDALGNAEALWAIVQMMGDGPENRFVKRPNEGSTHWEECWEDHRDCALEQIQAKCVQYWNEPSIDPAEVHAILGFIHARVSAHLG